MECYHYIGRPGCCRVLLYLRCDVAAVAIVVVGAEVGLGATTTCVTPAINIARFLPWAWVRLLL